MELEYDLQLLASRLSAIYGKEQAKVIMSDNKENLFGYRGLAWSLGKRDIHFFNMYFLKNIYVGNGKAKLAPVHFNMWTTMQNMYIKNSHDRHAFVLPRGTGKSLTGSLPIALWASLYGHSKYTVVASAVNDTAMSFINNMRNALIDNKRIENAFGVVYDSKLINTTDRIELANKSMIQALSSRSTFRGKSYLGNRINLLILDDFQSDENVTSKEQMDKHWKRFSDDSGNAIEKDNYKMIAMGTIITKNDFYDRLLHLPTWKSTKEKAVQEDDIDILFNSGKWKEFSKILFDTSNQNRLDYAKEFYFQNKNDMQYKLLWQDYWDCLDMALNYYENPSSFKQELQLEVDGDVSKKFFNIQSYDDISNMDSVLVIDPAGSENKAKGDYYAFVIGQMELDKIYIEKSIIKRFDFEDYIQFTIDLLKKYPQINTIIVEKQVYNSSDVIAMKNLIQRDTNLYYRDFNWINEHQTKNKDTKIDSIVGDVNMGRVLFNPEDINNNAIEQLKDFTNAKSSPHDDYPDALAELIIYLKQNNLNDAIVEFKDFRAFF